MYIRKKACCCKHFCQNLVLHIVEQLLNNGIYWQLDVTGLAVSRELWMTSADSGKKKIKTCHIKKRNPSEWLEFMQILPEDPPDSLLLSKGVFMNRHTVAHSSTWMSVCVTGKRAAQLPGPPSSPAAFQMINETFTTSCTLLFSTHTRRSAGIFHTGRFPQETQQKVTKLPKRRRKMIINVPDQERYGDSRNNVCVWNHSVVIEFRDVFKVLLIQYTIPIMILSTGWKRVSMSFYLMANSMYYLNQTNFTKKGEKKKTR